ncbi:hypothetical protein [Curtobacterium sp. MCPF17_021]|uniref:hypothetical protein n=1 Tax=Curtobacterium sp. MCPF17_021 TaxID=2175639 RepID=UPI000DA989A4|nr:hypothetical protein [Curtobacterium sp. MCPF17_021]WIE82562.1 hypothetical protein DEJ29_014380 [Curtobacterium sp. MCPF17_021]
MSDTTPTNGHGPDGSDPANRATTPTGWGAAPTSTSTLDAPAPQQPQQQQQQQQPYRADAGAGAPGGWDATAPNGATPWYGAAAGAASPTNRRSAGPKPPWFWPLLAAIVGLAALLVGGGVGFAIGHAIGADRTQSTTQVPGTNRFPGNGTDQAPGSTDGTGS